MGNGVFTDVIIQRWRGANEEPKIITAEGNKLCPDKPAQKKTDISTWKISKNIGGNKASLNAAHQKQVKSQGSSEQNKELDGNVELKTAQIVDRSEKMPRILPLKPSPETKNI
ncbi:hypothetical protein M0R45_013378 [Rubus argutus]|uniref:Uncharacterized protein n=1 Tax=Rubus argutus TaxID=59490 RepID=A0AAW1XLJ0_RUBAR